MGKIRRNPLLEAFRAADVGDREPGAVPRARGTDRSGSPGSAGPSQMTLGDTPFLVVRVSLGALLALVAGLVALVAIAFLLGQTLEVAGRGEQLEDRSQASTPSVVPPAPESRREALPPAVAPSQGSAPAPGAATRSPIYTVQVAIYGSGNVGRAEELKTSLLSSGIPDVEVIAIGGQHRVCVGRFPSAEDEAAKLALKRVQALSPEYSSAFINRLQ